MNQIWYHRVINLIVAILLKQSRCYKKFSNATIYVYCVFKALILKKLHTKKAL